MKLSIDFETYSESDIGKEGAWKYSCDPSTEVLMMAYSVDDNPPLLWTSRENKPFPRSLLERATEIWAFNAAFERAIIANTLKIEIPMERFRCSMVLAYSMAFIGGLDRVLAQSGLNDRKLDGGRQMILRFCKPQSDSRKVKRWTCTNDPENWARFEQYCLMDVQVEMKLRNALLPHKSMRPADWKLWHLDQKINDLGVPIDLEYAEAALSLRQEARKTATAGLRTLTQLENPLSRNQMMSWIKDLPDMKSQTILDAIANNHPESNVLGLYSAAVSTAPTKYQAFVRGEVSGRVQQMFQFLGASRTGRWSGRRVQLQNLKRGNLDATTLETIQERNFAYLNCIAEPNLLLAQGVRSTITAPEGKTLVVSDLSSIESRVLAWVAQDPRMMRVFAEGRDTYKDFAAAWFGIPYHSVTKEQRNLSKAPTLGSGYGIGAEGMKTYAEGFGVTMSIEEAQDAVYAFRRAYSKVPELWADLDDTVQQVLKGGQPAMVGTLHLALSQNRQFLNIRLPTGRKIYYFMPRWEEETVMEGTEREFTTTSLSYMGKNQYTQKWERIHAWGAKLTENIVQAIARDVLATWMVRADNAGFTIVGHVHDELICEETEDRVQELDGLIKAPIAWAPGLLLDAQGYTAKRYRK